MKKKSREKRWNKNKYTLRKCVSMCCQTEISIHESVSYLAKIYFDSTFFLAFFISFNQWLNIFINRRNIPEILDVFRCHWSTQINRFKYEWKNTIIFHFQLTTNLVEKVFEIRISTNIWVVGFHIYFTVYGTFNCTCGV